MTKQSQAAAETLAPRMIAVAAALTSTLPPQLIAQMERLLRKAGGKFDGIDPNLDPDAILRIVGQLGRWIERARDHDNTPLLLQVPDPVTAEPLDVSWLDLFAALTEHAKRTIAHGVVWVPRPEGVVLLSQAASEAQEVFERVKIAIDGSGVEAEEVAELRERIIGTRTISRSRSGLKLELGFLRVGIEESPDVPPSLRVLLPVIIAAKVRLTNAVEGKRIPAKVKQYTAEVHVAILAILLAMNEFLSWAAGTATISRLRTFRRIVAPRHRTDGTPVHRLDPDAPAEEDEEIDPQPEDDEEDGPASPSDDLLPQRNVDATVAEKLARPVTEPIARSEATEIVRSEAESGSQSEEKVARDAAEG